VLLHLRKGAMEIGGRPVTMAKLGERVRALMARRRDKLLFVRVDDDVRLDKSLRLLRMAGTLHVDERAAAAGEKLVFRLEADYAR